MCFTLTEREKTVYLSYRVKLWNWQQQDVYWNNQPSAGGTRLGCALSATFPQFVSPITMQTTQGLCVTASNRLSSGLLVFSSGFLKTQVYGFYSLITAFTKAFHKRIIILFDSRIVLMLKWLFLSGWEGKKITLMLSSLLYQSSLEL